MKSEILRDEIINKINCHTTIIKDYENHLLADARDGLDYDPIREDEHEAELKSLALEITDLLSQLYKSSVVDYFHFFDCPYSVYSKIFFTRLKRFSHKYIDANVFDYLKDELKYFSNSKINQTLSNELFDVNYSQFSNPLIEFSYSNKKKIDFLIKEIESIGYEVEKLINKPSIDNFNNPNFEPIEYKFIFKFKKNKTDDVDSNMADYFTYEKDKSIEHNLSKLTIFPTVVYDNGELSLITVPVKFEEDFITDINELKSLIIQILYKEIRKLEPEYKFVFTQNLIDNLKWKIEALESQLNIVKNNYSKCKDNVLGVLSISLSLNQDVDKILKKIIAIETIRNISLKNNSNKTEINIKEVTPKVSGPEDNLKLHPIFLNINGFNLFEDMLVLLSISEDDPNKSGNQAKFHAIWEVSNCKSKIFKPFTPLGDYTSYLNKKYKTEYKNRSFSDGSRYHSEIKTALSLMEK